MSDMIKIFSTPESVQMSIAEAILNDAGIENFRLSKQDSSYLMFGNFELYTKSNQAREAYRLLKEKDILE